MDVRAFHWITLATAVVATLGAASSLAIEAARPAAVTMAGADATRPGSVLPATASQTPPKS